MVVRRLHEASRLIQNMLQSRFFFYLVILRYHFIFEYQVEHVVFCIRVLENDGRNIEDDDDDDDFN